MGGSEALFKANIDASKHSVLVVGKNDDRLVKAAVAALLHSGFQVTKMSTAVSALASVRNPKSQVDLVVCRSQLGTNAEGGVEFLRVVRKSQLKLPVIMLVDADTPTAVIAKCVELKAADCVQPEEAEMDALDARVRALLHDSSKVQQLEESSDAYASMPNLGIVDVPSDDPAPTEKALGKSSSDPVTTPAASSKAAAIKSSLKVVNKNVMKKSPRRHSESSAISIASSISGGASSGPGKAGGFEKRASSPVRTSGKRSSSGSNGVRPDLARPESRRSIIRRRWREAAQLSLKRLPAEMKQDVKVTIESVQKESQRKLKAQQENFYKIRRELVQSISERDDTIAQLRSEIAVLKQGIAEHSESPAPGGNLDSNLPPVVTKRPSAVLLAEANELLAAPSPGISGRRKSIDNTAVPLGPISPTLTSGSIPSLPNGSSPSLPNGSHPSLPNGTAKDDVLTPLPGRRFSVVIEPSPDQSDTDDLDDNDDASVRLQLRRERVACSKLRALLGSVMIKSLAQGVALESVMGELPNGEREVIETEMAHLRRSLEEVIESPADVLMRDMDREPQQDGEVELDPIVDRLMRDLAHSASTKMANMHGRSSTSIVGDNGFDSVTKQWLLNQYMRDGQGAGDANSDGGTGSNDASSLDSPASSVHMTAEEEDAPESPGRRIMNLVTLERSWNLLTLDLDEYSLVSLGCQVFKELGMLSRFKIKDRALVAFVSEVSRMYRDVPYHRFAHAIDVLHSMYMLVSDATAKSLLTDVDIFALLVAALCHDLDHPGVNNNFLVTVKHPIALLYNDISVLENHHAAHTFTLLNRSHPGLLKALSKDETVYFRKCVVSSILATDMATHFDLVNRFHILADSGTYSRDNKDDRLLLCNVLLHAADISNPVRSYDSMAEWAACVREEFFSQGDLERSQSLPVSAFMSRDKPEPTKMQVNFMDFIVLPLFREIAKLLPEGQACVGHLEANRETLQKRPLVEDSEGPKGVRLQKDADLGGSLRSSLPTLPDISRPRIPTVLPAGSAGPGGVSNTVATALLDSYRQKMSQSQASLRQEPALPASLASTALAATRQE